MPTLLDQGPGLCCSQHPSQSLHGCSHLGAAAGWGGHITLHPDTREVDLQQGLTTLFASWLRPSSNWAPPMGDKNQGKAAQAPLRQDARGRSSLNGVRSSRGGRDASGSLLQQSHLPKYLCRGKPRGTWGHRPACHAPRAVPWDRSCAVHCSTRNRGGHAPSSFPFLLLHSPAFKNKGDLVRLPKA